MAWHSTHSRENDGVRDDTLERAIRGFCRVFVGGTGTFPADNLFLPSIICSTVFRTCLFDMPRLPDQLEPLLAGTCFRPTLFWHCLSRAGAACKGGNYASFDASCRCYPAACRGVLLAPAANAQVQSPPGLSEQPPNISDQKLDAAAAAIERVASLKQDYQQRIAAAAPADKERILNEAVNALAKAVTDQGLSVEEYDSILEVAQNGPDIREKIRQRIRPSAQ